MPSPESRIEALYIAERQILLGYAFIRLLAAGQPSMHTAEELVHDGWARFLGSTTIDWNRNPGAYLQKCVENVITAYLRRNSKRSALELEAAELVAGGRPDNFEERVATADFVRRGLGLVKGRERDVLILHYLCDLDFNEVAARLGIKSVTARGYSKTGLARIAFHFPHGRDDA